MPPTPHPTHQAGWVLLSASADHAPQARTPQLQDAALLSARALNATAPTQLRQRLPTRRPWARWRHARCGVLLTGELRCLTRSKPLLQRLAQQADLFIVTTEAYAKAARQLAPARQCLMVEAHPAAAQRDQQLAVGSMKQWHKLALALELVEQAERRRGQRYSHLIKLRSDYFYAHPQRLLPGILTACRQPDAGLVGASDKVFAGPRELMMLFRGFFQAIDAWFDQQEERYWPINLQQVLASDEALKWYGMNWPVELIGRPASTEAWRRQLADGGDALALALARFQGDEQSRYHRLFQGHSRFASEVCFARFLNFNGIPFRDCPSLRGFLYSDRSLCP